MRYIPINAFVCTPFFQALKLCEISVTEYWFSSSVEYVLVIGISPESTPAIFAPPQTTMTICEYNINVYTFYVSRTIRDCSLPEY